MAQKRNPAAELIWTLLALAAVVSGLLWVPYRMRQGGVPLPSSFDSIAVLPMRESGEESGTADCLAELLSQELIARLVSLPGLKVVPWMTAQMRRRSSGPIPELAGLLQVDAILTCSVRKKADRIQVSLALVDGLSGQRSWGDRWEVPVSELTAVQGRIALAAASRLKGRLTARQSDALVHPADSGAPGRLEAGASAMDSCR